jgi:F-type H+-transporting ATPase subunit b
MLLAAREDSPVIASLTTAFREGGVDVDLDLTVFVQAGLFVLLLLILKPLLFDPMLKLFEEREKRIEGARVQARKIDEKSTGALATYEAAMTKARAEANAERDKLRAEAMKVEAEILAKVRETTNRMLDEGKRSAQSEAARVRASLQAQSAELAKELAGRVLGREVQG